MVLSREEVSLLQDILHRQTNIDPILTEVQKAILFLQEAMWKDRVVILRVRVIVVLLQRAVADLHTVADHPQVPPHRAHLQVPPHQAEAEVVEAELQEEDSLKVY
jgi:hypothetical protein